MKKYQFIIKIQNSTIIEVEANDYLSAEAAAADKAYDTGLIADLCNPSDVEVDVEWDSEEQTRRASTNMVGKTEDALSLCRELNTMLGRNEFAVAADVPHRDGSRLLVIVAEELTDSEIESLNLNEDFIID